MDFIEIQRLVDGELSKADRIDFLKRIESQPEHWRTVALSFIEEQSFRDGVRTVFYGTSQEAPSTAVQNRFSDIDASNASTATRPSVKAPSSSWGFLALAAGFMILVGFSLGRYDVRSNRAEQELQLARDSGSSIDSSSSKRSFTSDPRDLASTDAWGQPIGELTFASDGTLNHSGLAAAERSRNASADQTGMGIPIYEVKADQAKRWMDAESKRVNVLRDSLRQQGYELDLKPHRIEKRLPDGRSLIVPVNQWNVRPFGQ